MTRVHPSWPPALTDEPRWSQTCPDGHFTSVRQPARPAECPTCGKRIAVCAVDTERGAAVPDRKKRPSGDAALFTDGTGGLLR